MIYLSLYDILPGMFQRIDDYTELLLPDDLLREGSVIERMVVKGTSDSIPESDWTDQVQIILLLDNIKIRKNLDFFGAMIYTYYTEII